MFLSSGSFYCRYHLPVNAKLSKASERSVFIGLIIPYRFIKADHAILVKEASIGTDQLGKFLYAVNDSDIVHYRHIEIGQLINDTLRQVLGGLSPQERYVTEALMKVRDGMKIKPIP